MQDDDFLLGPVPDVDDPPSAEELAEARRFAAIVDKSIAGQTPRAMAMEDRALLDVATVIRAVHGNAELEASQVASVVDAALRQAVGEPPRAAPQRRSHAPWWIAGATTLVAVAALLLLWLAPSAKPPIAQRAELPELQRSRPADALIGPIARERADDARTRIDAIFADRLDGFRARRWGGSR